MRLTGLYNYGYFKEALHYEVEKSRRYKTPLSLLFLDIDDFKQVNDTLGHLKGDKIMRQVADYPEAGDPAGRLALPLRRRRICHALEPDAPGSGHGVGRETAPKHRPVFHEPAGTRLQFTVSIGVAGLGPEMSTEDLVKAADDAHYRAKQAGKNRVAGPEPAS